jgi:hypothetical protein
LTAAAPLPVTFQTRGDENQANLAEIAARKNPFINGFRRKRVAVSARRSGTSLCGYDLLIQDRRRSSLRVRSSRASWSTPWSACSRRSSSQSSSSIARSQPLGVGIVTNRGARRGVERRFSAPQRDRDDALCHRPHRGALHHVAFCRRCDGVAPDVGARWIHITRVADGLLVLAGAGTFAYGLRLL